MGVLSTAYRRSDQGQADTELSHVSTNRQSTQLPMLSIADNLRNNMIAAIGEFVGTFMFLFFGFVGAQVANTPAPEPGSGPDTSKLLYISLVFGFSLTVNVWAFYRVTGGMFNPAVTLALFLVGGLPAIRGVFVVISQIVAGICAAAVVSALFPGPLNVENTLGGGTNVAQGLFIEMFLTSQLVFVIIMLAVVKHKSTFLAPVGIGLTLFLCHLTGIYFTGASLNFARSLGPAVVNHSFPHYFWIYFLGPMLGSCLASSFYFFLNKMRYETCNPGQDAESLEDPAAAKERQLSSSTTGGDLGVSNGVSNGVNGDVNGSDRTINEHQTNISETAAINSGYADKNKNEASGGDYQYSSNSASGHPYSNQSNAN
ncbi:hypothetical protein EYB25_009991 [Talaromyces marneffei]|uniref:Aquaporin-1 n=1 Tax=Talaromyces marneffei PM1 TaxID=1077442 RepID=A0A093VD10_TALMA|nr:uncharacterized protein EYB26_009256 [Talaromyces marneffei]KAE8548197.1 hypothetical protein EYB25_009991 [Talaromyces marneffei]QGA21545.1 hypothetical protein EYB26_009256 [Talaromyces marneffei]